MKQKRPPGRPRLPEKRGTISVCLTPTEQARVRAAAIAAQRSFSDWMRFTLLNAAG